MVDPTDCEEYRVYKDALDTYQTVLLNANASDAELHAAGQKMNDLFGAWDKRLRQEGWL